LADRKDDRHSPRVTFPKRGLVAAELAALAVIVAAHVGLLTVLLHTRTTFDEGVYLLSLDELRHGQALGREVFTSQGPAFYVLLQAIGAVFGVSVAGVRLGIVTIDALGAMFGFLLGRRLAGPLGGLACAGMIAIAPKLGDFGGRVFADQCAMVIVVLALWLVTMRWPLPAGAAFAAALLVKVNALTALPTFVVLLALERRRKRSLLEAAAGALALVGIFALVYIRDLRGIWAGAVTYHTDSRHITGLIGRHEFEGFFAVRTPFFWLTLLAIALLPLVWRRVWPFWLWGILAAVFVLRYQPLRDNHLLVLPYAFAVPAGLSLGLAARRLPPRLLVPAVVAGALVFAAGWVQQLHRVRLDKLPEDPRLIAAAAQLDRLTRPNQLVISDQPIVAFLAHRRVPGKYVDTASLRFDTGSLTEPEVLHDAAGVAALFAGRAFSERPSLLAALPSRFRHRLDLPGGVIFYGH
jgi:4-amino-4-deoxy-L-arabinose transferase-like glycosyltransferase